MLGWAEALVLGWLGAPAWGAAGADVLALHSPWHTLALPVPHPRHPRRRRRPQEDTFTTCSGRSVALRIFTRAHDIGRVDFAMQSLKRSMK